MAETRRATFAFFRTVTNAVNAHRAQPRTAPWSTAAASLTSIILSVLLLFVQRRALGDVFALSTNGTPGPDAWLYSLALVSTSLVLLAPSVLLSAVVARCRGPGASCQAFLGLAVFTLLLVLIDLDLLRSIGRHLAEIVRLALEPHGHVAGGSHWFWVAVVLQWAVVSSITTALVAFASQFVAAVARRLLTPLLWRVLGVAAGIGVLMAIAAPVLLLGAWGNHPAVERLYASALVDIRPLREASASPHLDPRLRELHSRLSASWRAAFPALTASKPGDTTALALPPRPPNVVLIVTESFRHDALQPESMPRLSRWAKGGLVAARHDAGTIYSQSGAFALLYGRSPAVYHQTLDAEVPPQFCASLRSAGYECGYFTGHPKEWMRREDFLNNRTMDHFVHDDRGSWPDWDKRALDNMVTTIERSTKPVFATVLLMSSHFEYRYPPEYEIDRPVSNTTWLVTMVSALGPDAEVPHRNRYRNCMRFIDDAVADAIARLDPERNIIIVTGDHGESINDDGHYTHGYSYAEVLTRTPFVMVGPGIEPARIDVPTSHLDVLPSVLHALSGQRPKLAHLHGVDWLAGERPASLLEAHSPLNKQRVEAQLRVDGRRLRMDLDLTRPTISLLGFEDEMGRLLPTPELPQHQVDQIVGAFDDQLSTLRR